MITVYNVDALETLQKKINDETVDLIYIDPPFGTQKQQKLSTVKAVTDTSGLFGFGRNYKRIVQETIQYNDKFIAWDEFINPIFLELSFKLKPTGLMYVHLDYRNVHYARFMLDTIFSPECFLGEIIWTWDYGARTKKFWPRKHNNILVYAKDINNYYFDLDRADRLPYMAPALQKDDRAEFGKSPTSCWWISVEGTNSKLRTGWPNQKPYKLLERIVTTSSPENGLVLDCFAGSGITGKVANDYGRNCILIEKEEKAIELMREKMFSGIEVNYENCNT